MLWRGINGWSVTLDSSQGIDRSTRGLGYGRNRRLGRRSAGFVSNRSLWFVAGFRLICGLYGGFLGLEGILLPIFCSWIMIEGELKSAALGHKLTGDMFTELGKCIVHRLPFVVELFESVAARNRPFCHTGHISQLRSVSKRKTYAMVRILPERCGSGPPTSIMTEYPVLRCIVLTVFSIVRRSLLTSLYSSSK
jgi:hypothetical protein